MKPKLQEFIRKVIPAILVFLAFVTPLFFVPLTTEFLEFNKQALILTATFLCLALWGLRFASEGSIIIKRSKFDRAVLLILISYLASLMFSQGRTVSGVSIQTWALMAIPVLYFIAVDNISGMRQVRAIMAAVMASGGILALIAIVKYFGINLFVAPWSQNRAFNTLGSLPNLSIYLLATFVMGLSLWLGKRGVNRNSELARDEIAGKPANSNASIFSFWPLVVAGLSLVALILINPLTSGLVGKVTKVNYPTPVTLDLGTSWSIAVEVLKRYPITGIGFELFDEAFTQFKPVSFNLSQYWSFRFGAAFNQWLHSLTLFGLLGVLALGYLMLSLLKAAYMRIYANIPIKSGSANLSESYCIGAGIIILALGSLLTTYATATWVTLFLLTAAWAKSTVLTADEKEEELKVSFVAVTSVLNKISGRPSSGPRAELGPTVYRTGALPVLVAIIVWGVSLTGIYLTGRFFTAEVSFKKSLDAVALNDGTATYTYQRRAISLNPYEARYHNQYAQTNLALADALAGREDITDQDRVNIQQLIQQAIRESKITTETLNPLNSSFWEVRARLYRNIIGVAANANQWSIDAYSKAITLDPLNPNIRIELGGIYYAQEDWDQAIAAFSDAVRVKRDHANSHYNLATALRKKGLLEQAINEYNAVLTLVAEGTGDYEAALKDMEATRGELTGEVAGEATEPSNTEELQGPPVKDASPFKGVEIPESTPGAND